MIEALLVDTRLRVRNNSVRKEVSMRRLNNKNCRVRMQEESRIVAVVPERQRRSSNNGDDCGGLEISQYIICSLSNPGKTTTILLSAKWLQKTLSSSQTYGRF